MLNITQPTLSGQVKELEERYGTKLFLRHGRRIELTDIGKSAYAITRQLFRYEEEVEPFEEENQHTNDGAQCGVDPSDGGGKATDPDGDCLGGKSAGTGDASVTDEVGSKDTGEGKVTGKA